jgi:DNA invertase Pin-like site-specific DNA recombinase
MNEARLVKVAGYIRISTDEERQRYSLSAQEDAIRKYVESHRRQGYRLFRIYPDQKSAASLVALLFNIFWKMQKGVFLM